MNEGWRVRGRFFIPATICWLALAVTLSAQQFIFRPYRQPEGLGNLALNALATDRKGYLWLATENGVYRFLGAEFVRFGPEQGIGEVNIQSILLDQNDNVWAGTDHNLYRLDGKRFVPALATPIHILAWNSMAVEDAHHLLIVEDHRLFRLELDGQSHPLSYHAVFSPGLLGSFPLLAHVLSVGVVHNSRNDTQVWIGAGKRLFSFTDGSPEDSPGSQSTVSALREWGTEDGLGEDSWSGVLLDRFGTLWAGGHYRLAALPHGARRFIEHSIPGSSPGNVYPHAPLLEDNEGRILAPTEDGIARWNGSTWQPIVRANGLDITGHVVGMSYDATGDLWLGIRGDGIFEWAGYGDWEGWNNPNFLPSAVIWAAIPSGDGRFYVGTDKGPAWIDPYSGSSGPLVKGHSWPYGQVDTLGRNADGSLWAGTFSGAVLRIDPATGKTEQTGKLPFITRSVSDTAGRVYYTTDDGIYLRDAKSSRNPPRRITEADPLLTPSKQVDAGCLAPDGTLWFLTNNRLIRFDGRQWTAPPVDGIPSIHGTMLDLTCAPDGSIWMAGQQTGVWRLTPGIGRLEAWQLPPPHGLESLVPVAIAVDRRGWVWLGTDDGLLVWNGRTWRHLTQESGLTWNDVNQGVIRIAADGSLWVGTSGGMAHLLHPENVFDPVPLGAMISDIHQGNQSYPPTGPLRLPWSSQPITFRISSPATRNRTELVFLYRMEGLQPEWVQSRDGVAIISALPPGNYTFTAMAANPGLSAVSPLLHLQIGILPPWWRSNWFFALCALVLLLCVIAFDRMRVRSQRQTRRRLECLVHERTIELENSRELLRFQAMHDGLTGMLNRGGIMRVLNAEMDRARRESSTVVVALVDLDHFKRINDTYGHMAGDEALRWFTTAVESAKRSYDHAGRYGGEEFLLVLPQVPCNAIEVRLAALHKCISSLRVETREAGFTFTCSIGATVYHPAQAEVSIEGLLATADKALYAAKAGGRNRFVFCQASADGSTGGNPSGTLTDDETENAQPTLR